MSRTKLTMLKRREPLRIGFLPVSDCAPVVYAHEAGLFAKYELDVHLQREMSWANVRDKVVNGDLDAAHAPATLPFLANLGLESDPCACVSGLVLSLQGNVITISRKLFEEGVHDAHTLRERVYQAWGKRTFTFGVVFSFSPQEFLLRQWLRSAGIVPELEVRIVAVPPAHMFPTLKLGYVDGYCVGEPWASLAVEAGVGVCVASSAGLAPLHPEKVLIVRQSFAAGREEEHRRMLAALLEACAFCDQPENRPVLSRMLADPHYVNAPFECVGAAWGGGKIGGETPAATSIFHRHHANEPTDAKAKWLMDGIDELFRLGSFKVNNTGRTPVLKNVFRRDIYEAAKATLLARVRQDETDARNYQAGANLRTGTE